MLFEQSFMALPEFLTGFPYQDYDYEATLLTAFAMAVLQEFNGRNINNPISGLRSEVSYQPGDRKRADLHINLKELNVFTDQLSSYGFYQDNWLESKYFRINDQGKPTVDKLKVVLFLLKDLIRLVALPPENLFPDSQCGRYLLHAYRGDPKHHIAKKKNKTATNPGFTRSWAEKIRQPGRQDLVNFNLKIEVSQFDSIIGNSLRDLSMDLKVMNFCQEPMSNDPNLYWCYLTRIDDFRVVINDDWFERKCGKFTESDTGKFVHIRNVILLGLANCD